MKPSKMGVFDPFSPRLSTCSKIIFLCKTQKIEDFSWRLCGSGVFWIHKPTRHPLKMNYIAKLKTENEALTAKVESTRQALNDFSAFLSSPKFQTKEGGERADWISTGDVQRFLSELKATL